MRIAIVMTSLVLTLSPTEASTDHPAPTPFDLLEDGSLIVPVTIGGTGPYWFVLDTGSSRTVISTRLWQSLRSPVVSRTVMVTPGFRRSLSMRRLWGRIGMGRAGEWTG